jgi:pilus assembly protein CpaC
MTRNGTEANFLAGGEFPIPVLQGGALQGITIVFKEFGVRLKFLPVVQPDGAIRLKVQPEVSSLDFANALTVSGFLVPALSTRRAETEVDLRDGQSFAIAGLIDNRTREIGSKIPVLGDVPIIGTLFKSRSQRRDNTELLVMVTPRLVRPIPANEPVPNLSFPKPFLDKDRFDGKTGPVQPARPAP